MKKKVGLLVVLGLIVILFLLFPAFCYYLKSIYLDTTRQPVWGVEAVSVFLKDSVFFFPRLIRTFQENPRLQKEIESLNKSLLELKEVSLENERLRQLLSFKKDALYQSIPARVIGRDYSNWVNTILINKGSKHGLKVNMAVVSSSGLAGKIIEVSELTSRILLLIDSDCRVAGLVQRTREEGIVEGYFSRCRMKYLDPQADVNPGDVVLTSGSGGIYPKGLLIGKVTAVSNEPGSMYKYALVQPAVNLFRIEEVLCILPSK